ncbi:hypothetical protein MTO96_009491 [Rhipicephalus appendiculatus]
MSRGSKPAVIPTPPLSTTSRIAQQRRNGGPSNDAVVGWRCVLLRVSCASAARCCQLASGRATQQRATPDRRATDPVAVATSSRHGEGSGDSAAAVFAGYFVARLAVFCCGISWSSWSGLKDQAVPMLTCALHGTVAFLLFPKRYEPSYRGLSYLLQEFKSRETCTSPVA